MTELLLERSRSSYSLSERDYSSDGCSWYRLLRVLLSHGGTDLNGHDGHNQTALYISCDYGHSAIARLLLEKGADPDTAEEDGSNPLIIVSEKGHVEVVEVLLNHKAIDLNHQDRDGFTALYLSFWQNHSAITKNLLDKGVDPSIGARTGHTP